MSVLVKRVLYLSADLAMLAGSTHLALCLRENLAPDAQQFGYILPYLLVSVGLAAIIFPMFSIDRTCWRYCSAPDLARLALAIVTTVAAATLITFLANRMDNVSRSLPILQLVIATFALLGVRVAAREWARNRGRLLGTAPVIINGSIAKDESALVIGVNALAQFYLQAASEFGHGRLRVVGVVSTDDGDVGQRLCDKPIFGASAGLDRIIGDLKVHGVSVERIVIVTSRENLPINLRARLAELAAGSTIKVTYLADDLGIESRNERASTERKTLADSFPIGGVECETTAGRSYWRWKRWIDVCVSFVALVLLAPLLAVVALLVAATIGFPTVFWQERPGWGGRNFRLYKFRTMSPAYDGNGALRSDDARLTVVGRFLRASRIDELPQLWNVLIGDMSLVGPRPLLPEDQPDGSHARLLIRPGLTGWAQVMGGRSVDAADKIALDLWYFRNSSLKLDFEIAYRTIPMILFGERISPEAIGVAWEGLMVSGAETGASGSRGDNGLMRAGPAGGHLGARSLPDAVR